MPSRQIVHVKAKRIGKLLHGFEAAVLLPDLDLRDVGLSDARLLG